MIRAAAEAGNRFIVEVMQARRGHRAQLVEELRELAEGWDHLGKDKQKRQALAAAEKLQRGAKTVTAGHTSYEVQGVTRRFPAGACISASAVLTVRILLPHGE